MEKQSNLMGNPGQSVVQADAEGGTTALMQLLVGNVRDYAIILLDTQGRVLTWNGGAERLMGWKSAEIVGQHFSRFYPPEDIAKGKTEMELAAAGKTGRFEDEGWRVRKDGARFWANAVITALRDKDGILRGFGKLTRNLTERRANEERINKQAQEIQEMATVPVVQVWEGVVLAPLIWNAR
jgi:PAS domain S-box-containing protein